MPTLAHLLHIGAIDKLSVLFSLFGKAVIPEVVAAECLVDKIRPDSQKCLHFPMNNLISDAVGARPVRMSF